MSTQPAATAAPAPANPVQVSTSVLKNPWVMLFMGALLPVWMAFANGTITIQTAIGTSIATIIGIGLRILAQTPLHIPGLQDPIIVDATHIAATDTPIAAAALSKKQGGWVMDYWILGILACAALGWLIYRSNWPTILAALGIMAGILLAIFCWLLITRPLNSRSRKRRSWAPGPGAGALLLALAIVPFIHGCASTPSAGSTSLTPKQTIVYIAASAAVADQLADSLLRSGGINAQTANQIFQASQALQDAVNTAQAFLAQNNEASAQAQLDAVAQDIALITSFIQQHQAAPPAAKTGS